MSVLSPISTTINPLIADYAHCFKIDAANGRHPWVPLVTKGDAPYGSTPLDMQTGQFSLVRWKGDILTETTKAKVYGEIQPGGPYYTKQASREAASVQKGEDEFTIAFTESPFASSVDTLDLQLRRGPYRLSQTVISDRASSISEVTTYFSKSLFNEAELATLRSQTPQARREQLVRFISQTIKEVLDVASPEKTPLKTGDIQASLFELGLLRMTDGFGLEIESGVTFLQSVVHHFWGEEEAQSISVGSYFENDDSATDFLKDPQKRTIPHLTLVGLFFHDPWDTNEPIGTLISNLSQSVFEGSEHIYYG